MIRSRILALLTICILLATATPALATPLSDKRAEAERARDAVAEVDRELEIAAENYNEARAAYDELSARVAENEARLAELNGEIGELETHLTTRVENMYRTGPLGMLEVLLDVNSFGELAATWDVLMDVSERESTDVAQLRDARAEAKATEAELETQRAEAKSHYDEMATQKAAVEARLAERERTLAGLEDEVAALEDEEERRQAAAAAAARRTQSYTSRGSDSGGTPTRAPRSGVVGIAMQYLGTPYRWAASGPNAFDCSGFTMYVYAQVGVSLPHSSRAQYGCGERVSRANLAPGDLVFFGSPIHHVGMYVGNGNYIHSPRTGDVVKISPLNRSDYVGAVRP
jgi:cell wall-associated NlpC family hydrolase